MNLPPASDRPRERWYDMNPRLLALPIACLVAACASERPDPQPDPAQVERLLAQLDACDRPCDGAEAPGMAAPHLPANVAEDVQAADRLMPAIERMPADRLDPSVAAAFLQ